MNVKRLYDEIGWCCVCAVKNETYHNAWLGTVVEDFQQKEYLHVSDSVTFP